MNYITIVTLLILFAASIFLVFWVFRPGSKEQYDEISMIPLHSDGVESKKKTTKKKVKKGKSGGTKKAKKK